MSYKPSPNGPEGKDWTRVDSIVDSGASDSTIPKGILPNVPLGEVKGFREFSMADGRILPNLGSKKVTMAFQCRKVLQGSFSVCDTTKPLLSIGKMVEHGHTVTMTPYGGYILKGSKLPVWIWTPVGNSGFQGQGQP